MFGSELWWKGEATQGNISRASELQQLINQEAQAVTGASDNQPGRTGGTRAVRRRDDTGRGKDWFKIRDLLADTRCSRAVLDFLLSIMGLTSLSCPCPKMIRPRLLQLTGASEPLLGALLNQERFLGPTNLLPTTFPGGASFMASRDQR